MRRVRYLSRIVWVNVASELVRPPLQDGVTPVAVAESSLAARKLQDEKDEWLSAGLLMAWSRRATQERRAPTGRNGCEGLKG